MVILLDYPLLCKAYFISDFQVNIIFVIFENENEEIGRMAEENKVDLLETLVIWIL